MTDDVELIAKTLKGDQQAFRWMIKKYQHLVAVMVSRIIKDKQDREEVCQDVFIKVYEKLATYRGDSKLSTWIVTIAYRTSLNFIKKKKLDTIDLENVEWNWQSDHYSDAPMVDSDTKKILEEAIMKLPLAYRTIVTLFHLEQLSYEEITEITEMPVGTVKSYLFRARNLLKEYLLNLKIAGAI